MPSERRAPRAPYTKEDRHAPARGPGRGSPEGPASGEGRFSGSAPEGAPRTAPPQAASAAGGVTPRRSAAGRRALRAWRNWRDAPASEAGGATRGGSTPSARICLRSSAEERRISTPGAEVRLLSGALHSDTAHQRRDCPHRHAATSPTSTRDCPRPCAAAGGCTCRGVFRLPRRRSAARGTVPRSRRCSRMLGWDSPLHSSPTTIGTRVRPA